MQQELIEMLEEIIQYVEVWNAHDQEIIDKAEALVEKAKKSAKEPAVPQTVYLVENRTCLLAYASREDADKAVASMPASVGGGFLVSPVQVFGAPSPAPAPAQEVPSDPNGWCQYVAGMVFGWLQMQEGLGLTSYDEDRFVEAIARIFQRRLWAYKPAQEPAKETFQSRHEREFMERMAGNHGKSTEFCAALESFTHDYQRLYSTYKSYRDMLSDLIKERDSLRDQVAKPAQEVCLTDEFLKEAAGSPEGYKFAAKGISKIDVWPHGGNWFPLYSLVQVQAIIAALRAKENKL